MIISEKYQFVFIHIPKCAGTSVRLPLQSYDSLNGRFTDRVDDHPMLGKLDYVHIPLFILRDHFRKEFESVRDYWSFAVMRDPFARFASSVTQRLKMYSDRPIQKRSLNEVRTVIDESINYLSVQPRDQHLLVPEYIHFQKQVDYIELDGVPILDTIYTVNQIDDLIADVGRHVGQNLVEPVSEGDVTRANRTVVYRNDFLRRVIETARPVTDLLGRILPEHAKQEIRNHVYVARDQRMKALFEANHVHGFISDYYADDIALYQQLSEQERSEKP